MARATEEAQLGDYLAHADAILLFHDLSILSELSFAGAPRCRCVVRAGVGYNNVDVAGRRAPRRGRLQRARLRNRRGRRPRDHVSAGPARRLVISHEAIRGGNWDYKTALGAPRLRGKTFGVVGCGRIGTAAALRAKAFGLDVVFLRPVSAQGMDKALGIRRVHKLEELLEQSHFVSLHCYLDNSTRHLLNAQTIARMRPGAILINTARGPVVDENALLDALDSGHLYAAGLDVIEREPLDYDRLRNHPRVLLTPHTAFYSVEGYAELRTKTAEEVRRILLGEPPRNPVNSTVILDLCMMLADRTGPTSAPRDSPDARQRPSTSTNVGAPGSIAVTSWLWLAMLTAVVTAGSCYQSLVGYHEFRSGWAWDLAYYNQWFWALCFGDGQVTVRPLSMFAEEGPSVWKMNYLAPIRFAVVPIYRLVPDPRTLLLVQNIVFWWVIPAAYSLVRFGVAVALDWQFPRRRSFR